MGKRRIYHLQRITREEADDAMQQAPFICLLQTALLQALRERGDLTQQQYCIAACRLEAEQSRRKGSAHT